MKYFVAWSYKGHGLHSHSYDFKYQINDTDDFNYLKAEIASNHYVSATGKSIDANDISIINVFALSSTPPTVGNEKYIYSIVYSVDEESGPFSFTIKENFFEFNTEIKTLDNVKDIFNRLSEKEETKRDMISILNWTLIEVRNEEDAG